MANKHKGTLRPILHSETVKKDGRDDLRIAYLTNRGWQAQRDRGPQSEPRINDRWQPLQWAPTTQSEALRQLKSATS